MAEATTAQARALSAALSRPRYEVLPLLGVEEDVAEHVPTQLPVTVTVSPRKGLDATLEVSERLARRGFRVIPHLAARMVTDTAHLAEVVARLGDAGVRDVFVVAGDVAEPVGQFPDSRALLTAMQEHGHRFDQIGIAGYPEGHPFVADSVLVDAVKAKQPDATYLVTQMCFEADAIASWVERMRGHGLELPVYAGITGVVDRRRLLRVATRIGLGPSARFLRRHRHPLSRLVLPRGYRPDRLVRGLAPQLADPSQGLAGLHVYTFNSLRETERWRLQTLERLHGGRT